MKPSEKEVLETLRKTTLAYLSESDYVQIEKAVEQQGILNLTGIASAIVKSAVQKHGGGSHDQATHGNWANGSGGGSPSSSAKPTENKSGGGGGLDSLSTKGASVKNKLNKIDAEKMTDREVTSRNRAVKLIDKANKHIEDAKSKSGDARNRSLSRAQDAVQNAYAEIDNADFSYLQPLADSIGALESGITSKSGFTYID
jgi:hypothetical protein